MPRSRQTEQSKVPAAAAATVAGAAPFAGMIGDRRYSKVSGGTRYGSHAEMASALRPGDILLTGEAKGKGTQATARIIGLGMGTRGGYHTAIVEKVIPAPAGNPFGSPGIQILEHGPDEGWRRAVIRGDTVSAGGKDVHNPKAYTVLRSTKDPSKAVTNAQKMVVLNKKVGDHLKSLGMKPESVAKLQGKAYDYSDIAKLTLRELFVPKLSRPKAPAVKDFDPDTLATEIANNIFKKQQTGQKITASDFRCMGGICTTNLAKDTGLDIQTRRATTPTDYLRSPDLRSVGHKLHKNLSSFERTALKAGPALLRGTVGIGLGAATYGALKPKKPKVKIASISYSALILAAAARRP